MLQHYFNIILRNIRRNKFYSILNIGGFAFGLTASLLIGLYIFDELSFDKFHSDYAKIYHIGMRVNFGGQEFKTASSCPPLASAMVNEIQGVEQATRLNPLGNVVVTHDTKTFAKNNVFLADSNFFEFFSFNILEGDPKTSLTEPYTAVLTPAIAKKYFGNQMPIGKIILLGDKKEAFHVSAIAGPAPANSHIQYDILISSVSDKSMQRGEWSDNNGGYTYYKKNQLTNLSSIEQNLKELVRKYIAPDLEKELDVTFAEFEKQGGVYSFFSYPLSRSHLYYPEIQDGASPGSDIKYVYILGAVGLFILLIACINFINLATARSASRAKEVGLRKTLGSVRSTLIAQFLAESVVYVFAAMTIAITGVYFLLPAFNLLSGKTLLFSTMLSPSILGGIVTIFILVTLLAGSYPAFYLTSFKPVNVLKGNVRAGMKSKGIRSSLVIVQFVISIALIICTMVVYEQLHFLQKKNIGLDKENVLVIQNTNRLGIHQEVFQESLLNLAEVVSASYTNNRFPGANSASTYRAVGATQDYLFARYFADYNHADVLNLELLQGRFFSAEFPTDSFACVINEAAVRELGWSNPLQEKFVSTPVDLHVIGVVKDFNFESSKWKVKPLVIQFQKLSENMLVRYRSSATEVVMRIEAIWKKLARNEPYEYTFLDQNFDHAFHEEQRLGQLLSVMTIITIFIACIGLFGLAAFTAEQRTKEIGIRKVLGATVASVNALLSKEFMRLVVISFVIASAMAWYVMNEWLSTFAYRIALGPFEFLSGGLMAAAIAWITVSYHFIKAARSNPTEALRCE